MSTEPIRAETVFAQAAEIADLAARELFVAEACGGDLPLKSRVEALLRAHDQPDSLLDVPLVAAPDSDNGATQALGSGPLPDHGSSRTSGSDSESSEDEEALQFLTPSTRPDSLGRLGHYEVLEVLGKGGFGIVFRAFDDMLQRVVAIKVMAPQIATLSPARKRFVREARSSAAVRHDNVVHVYEVGEQPLPYLVMEFVPGETLQQKLDRSGPLEVSEVLRIGRQIAEGLAAAHASDLIHRDIKPGNILLEGGSQKVKITDFGLARAADDASISQSGIIAGTPMFMAPEQALGQPIDQRADLFSLGSVLYQMASGRPPFRAPSALAVLKRVAEETPRPIPEIIPETPDWLCGIITKLHAKNPADRFQSAREVADVLADCEAKLKARREVKNVLPAVVKPAAPAASGRRWLRKRTLIVIPAAMLLALVVTWAWPSVANYSRNRGELEILPGEGLVSVIVLQNDEGVLDGDKLLPRVTDWLDMKKRHTLTVPPGKYQLNVGTWPEGTSVREWEVNTSGLIASSQTWVPVLRTSAIITLERGQRVTLRAKMQAAPIKPGPLAKVALPHDAKVADAGGNRPDLKTPPLAIAPFDARKAKEHQDAWAKHLGVEVEITNSIGMKLRLIPAGEFTAGTAADDVVKLTNMMAALHSSPQWISEVLREAPAVPARVPQPFYLGTCEVTNGQFRAFVEATKYETDGEKSKDGGWSNGPDGWRRHAEHIWKTPGPWKSENTHPVVLVSWNDAMAFCKWLSDKEGVVYSLPDERQWEFAARAGTTSLYGDAGSSLDSLSDFAWTKETQDRFGPHPVGSKKANSFGLFDMLGNASEWCLDPYPGVSGSRLVRGGAWYTDGVEVRPARRCKAAEGRAPDAGTGFRVAIVGDLRTNRPPLAKHEPLPPTFKNSIGMEFVIVPKGKSWLGGGNDKPGDTEVEIPADFYLGKYEVTQEEWQKVMGKNPSVYSRTGARRDAVKYIPDEDLKRFPVESVSWDDCQAFAAKLNSLEKETGWVYRLPTATEWEYACRGGPMSNKTDSAFDYYFDRPTNQSPPELSSANFLGLRRPCKVGSYLPNRLGLFDMHGNVAEFCEDSVLDKNGVSDRVNRGGGWNSSFQDIRAAVRYQERPSRRMSDVGLRLARVPTAAPSPEAKTPSVPAAKQEPLPPTFKNSIGMEFVIVPKGKSWLGGSKDIPGDKEAEIKEDFYLGKYVITQEEWTQVMGENPSWFSRTGKGKDAVKDIPDADLKRFPVELVSWEQCRLFSAKLNKLVKETGWVYRLPTETEWEYACRGGPMSNSLDSAFDFCFARPTNTLLPELANYRHDKGLNRTCKVGSYEPNVLGLYDMHGNVWEWLNDSAGFQRMVRGSCWSRDATSCGAAYRYGILPDRRFNDAGVRLVRVRSGAPSPELK